MLKEHGYLIVWDESAPFNDTRRFDGSLEGIKIEESMCQVIHTLEDNGDVC
jgi:hypothetical protein